MEKMSKEEVQAFFRNDLVAFSQRCFHELNPGRDYFHNWHIDVISEALEECRNGKLRRLVINLPPRNLKSHLASICFPAWLLGHDPASQVICASYAQDLADKLAADCRSVMSAQWYCDLFPMTRPEAPRQAVHDLATTAKGFRLATSVGGVLVGRGADYIVVDDPLKPDEALSDARRKAVNDWYDHSLITRPNEKQKGCIILIMQRLHEDDLIGHVLNQDDWKVLKFPAIAEEDECHRVVTPYGVRTFTRRQGEALHSQREPLEVLAKLREGLGEYHFAGQYQQTPAPAGGGLIKVQWFQKFTPQERPKDFEFTFQSWDSANKSSELSDYSVGTTWGVINKHLYLLELFRRRLNYPDLRRAVMEQAQIYRVKNILIEDKASGTQLIQDLIADGVHGVTRYEPKMDKMTRVQTTSSTIENGFVHIPEEAHWLAEYLHELTVFPKAKFDDQVDSTSQALDWFKHRISEPSLPTLIRVEVSQPHPFSSRSHALARPAPGRTGGWIRLS